MSTNGGKDDATPAVKIVPVDSDGSANAQKSFETLRNNMVEVDHISHSAYAQQVQADIHTKIDQHQKVNPDDHVEGNRAHVHNFSIIDYDHDENVAEQRKELEVDALYQAAHQGDSQPKSGMFGTWDGVYANSLLNIFGVILFLRLGWVVGQAGILGAIAIELLATSVTTLTTISMSAIATNGKVQGGGAYYMISRCLGPEIGGAVGVLFYLGMSVAIAMYSLGFIETLLDGLGVCPNTLCDGKENYWVKYNSTFEHTFNKDCNPYSDTYKVNYLRTVCVEDDVTLTLTENKLNDLRIWSLLMQVVLFIMAILGTGWIIKMQMGALASLVCIIIMLCICTTVRKDEENGFVGWGGKTKAGEDNLSENMKSGYSEGESFFSVFSVFFPAVTGIMAGANISGMLKTPAESIPKGTFYAIGHSTVLYIILTICVGAACQREDLQVDMLIMGKIDVSGGYLVLYAVYSATFTGALAALVGAPQILYALAKDGILPLDYFTVTHTAFPEYKKVTMVRTGPDLQGKEFRNAEGELCSEGAPVRAYILSFLIGSGCCCIGELNAVAPLISMFYLMTYGLVNWASFVMSHSASPSWRPSFAYKSQKGSFLGALLCLCAMFLTDVIWALGAIVIGYGLVYHIQTLVKKGTCKVHWGTAKEAVVQANAMNSVLLMRGMKHHARTFRPNFLVLLRDKKNRAMARLATSMKHGNGSCIVGHVVVGDAVQNVSLHNKEYAAYYQVNTTPVTYHTGCFGRGEEKHRPRTDTDSFVPMDEIVSESFYKGAISLMQVSGLGSLRPNVIQLGFSRYWEKSAAEGGTLGKVESKEKMQSNSTEIHEYIKVCDAAIKMHYGLVIASSLQTVAWDSYTQPGEVHIWWMAPDGGLTILLPQIMAKSPYWRKRVKKAKLFFVLPGNDSDEEVRDGILTAVDRLRIKMQPVFVSLRQNNPLDTANGEPDGPTKETVATYEGLAGVNPIGNQNNAKVDLRWVYRWLRISELVKENSSRAKFIYSSMPKKPPHCEPLDWYGILHMLQVSGPPMAMIAGNNINCLTMFQE